MDALRFGLRAFVAIFPIVNPFSAAILLLALTPGDSPERRREQVRRAIVFMTAILVVSYFAGSGILSFFSISRPALVLAAAVLVCRSGWRALAVTDRISPEAREEGLHKEDVSLTPIGMPMLAGPGAISVVIGLSADAGGLTKDVAGIVAILVVAVISYAVLAAAPAVARRLGRTGEAAISKVMGLITLSVGLQFLINGVSMVVHDLRG